MSGIPGLRGIDHVSITVPDLDAATTFYCDVVGGVLLHELGPFDARELPARSDAQDWTEAHIGVADARVRFRAVQVGTVILELFSFERPDRLRDLRWPSTGSGHGHVGFAVDDIDAAATYLVERGVTVMSGPIEVPPEAPGGAMLNRYFVDPWGNQLELTQRPH